MKFKSLVAGAAGVAVLAAPAATSTSPMALPSTPEVADQQLSAAAALDEKPVVVPAAATARAGKVAPAVDTTDPAEVPGVVLDAYTTAVALAPKSCRITVELLAAVGQVESGNLVGRQLDSDHRVTPAVIGPRLDGRVFAAIPDTDGGALDGDERWDRAVGPMQFLPSTWRSVGVDVDGDGERDPQSIYDAAGAAMVYLCAGRDLSDDAQLREAVLSYNRSEAYVAQVLGWKQAFEVNGLTRQQDVSFAAFQLPGMVDLGDVDLADADAEPRGTAGAKRKQAAAEGTKSPGQQATGATKGKQNKQNKQNKKNKGATPVPAVPGPTTPPDPGTTPAPTPDPTPAPEPTPDPTPTPEPTPDPAPEPEPAPVFLAAVMAFTDLDACEAPVGAPVEVDETLFEQLTVDPDDETLAVFPDATEQLIVDLCRIG